MGLPMITNAVLVKLPMCTNISQSVLQQIFTNQWLPMKLFTNGTGKFTKVYYWFS